MASSGSGMIRILRHRKAGCAVCFSSLFSIAIGAFAIWAPMVSHGQTDATLRVGIYQNEPKLFVADDGSAQGFFPLLIDELAARMERRVAYVPCDWASCLAALASGDIDLLPDVAYSARRAERIRFGHEAALHAVSYMYARPGVEAERLDVLDRGRLAVVAGSIQRDHIGELARERDWQVSLIEVADMNAVLERVAEDEADFGIVNDFFGNRRAPELGLVRTRFILQPTPLFLAFRPDMDASFVARLDAELAALKAAPDSIYYDAYRRWIEQPAVTRLPDWAWWSAAAAMLGLMAAVALALAYRRRARGSAAALRMSRKRLATITEAVDLGVWEWHRASGVLVWDAVMYRLYGMDPSRPIEGLGAWIDLVHVEDRRRIESEVERSRATGAPLDTEFRICRGSDGEVRHVKANARVSDADESHYMFGINLDVTRMRNLEGQLQQTQKMEALGALTGGIAHDFNNMLMVISSNLELAADGAEDAETRELLEGARLAAERASELTRRLLTFSRRQVLESVELDLNEQVRRTATFLNRIIPETIRIETRLSPQPLHAHLDPGQLENALVNLVINARDAMPEGGCLQLICDSIEIAEGARPGDLAAGHYLRVIVADDGLGMTDAVREHAMDPFFTTKEVGQGTGLGLAMVYGFVRQSGGDVVIDSTPGVGTRIELYFPGISVSVPAAIEQGGVQAETVGRGRSVLLVEDDPGVRQMLEKTLVRLGMSHRTCPDAPSALAAMESGAAVDLVLSDVVMPSGMSGIELAQRLRARWPQLPIILMSGYSADREASGTTVPAGVAWLNKPFTRAQLVEALRDVLPGVGNAP